MEKLSHITVLGNHLSEIGASLTHFMWLKIPICFVLGAFAFLVGFEHGDAVLTLLMLIVFDLAMGVGASYKNGYPIESRRILKTATKFATYMAMFSAAFMTENVILGVTLIDEAMMAFLCLTEFVSIMENAGKMGFMVPQVLLNQMRTLRDAK